MTGATFAHIGLQLRLWLMRFGWSNGLVALLVILGGSAWLWVLPHIQAQSLAQQKELLAVQKTLRSVPAVKPPPALPPNEQRLHDFYDALGETRYAEQQVKTLFDIAAKHGLTLRQAEYKFTYNQSGRFHTYTIVLPVKGTYAAIRPFCEQVLLAIPFAALDQVDFKRDAVSSTTLDAKLRFTLYLDDMPGIGAGMEEGVGMDSNKGGDQ